MRENFNKCLEMVLEHEGGYVNNENDRGGMTNLGVTRRVYEDWVDRPVSEQEMRDLTPEDVAPIYRKNYADRIHFDSLPSGLDWACLDWAINSGASRPAKAIQRAVGATADGVIGPKTLQLVAEKDPEFIIDYVYTVRQSFYESLDDYKHFGRGWSRRNKETLHQAMEMAKGGK
jgi:lysozyme family protein|tara:strand:+ start:3104 stop:3625 length:522 start_codon:yes stop_codon:yes gene_type:complete